MVDLGFKQITVENWREPDAAATVFVTLLPTGETKPTSAEDWVQLILAPQLAATVPEELHRLFEAARGAMVYGYLFYPLYALAAEQLFRVAEAVVFHKCRQLGYQERQKPGQRRDPIAMKIDWLRKQGVLSDDDHARWQTLRELRNHVSHADMQMIMMPAQAVSILRMLTEYINDLFPLPVAD